jgi:hypothetical protein
MTIEGKRWYPSGSKLLPLNLRLTPISLAGWFMGDGTSSIHIAGKTLHPTAHIIATKFSEAELKMLSSQIAFITGYEPALYIGNRVYSSSKLPRKELVFSRVESTNAFYNSIKEYITPSFSYKLKYGVRGGATS